MTRDTALLLIFGALFVTPFALAVGAALFARVLRPLLSVRAEEPRPRRRATPDRAEWPQINEYARRRDSFTKRTVLSGLTALIAFFAGLPLTGIAVLILLPLYHALTVLRCPVCDTATTWRGVTDGRYCLRCHSRLRY